MRLMINKGVKTVRAFILVSLALLQISIIMFPLQVQMNTPLSEEFSVPVTSDPNDFISVWNTTKISDGSSGSSQVQLPLNSDGQYNFTVYWDDGSNDTITNWDQAENTHTYASEGVYTITITGEIVGWQFNSGRDRLKLLEIRQWGCLQLGNLANYFSGCENLELIATDYLNLTGTTSLHRAFFGCTNLGSNGDMNGWDTSSVTSMVEMFSGASSFNQPIGNWDVSSVTSMVEMFSGASSFNQPIGNWDVSSLTSIAEMFSWASSFNQPIDNWDVSGVSNMRYMFFGASSFNQPIGNWDVSDVSDMRYMFREASSFNQPIGNWDVSGVSNMRYMFFGASSFNQPIGDWNISSLTTITEMFYYASSFNQPISNWDISRFSDMRCMFYGASSFNQPIGNWNVSSVTIMEDMFHGASSFNQPIGNWNVSSVTIMDGMFLDASSFNQPIGNWNVSSVTIMDSMFQGASSFNRPIGNWDVSSVTRMSFMFDSASSFNQDIGGWNVSNVIDMSGMFQYVRLSTHNYDSLLIGWSQLTLQTGVMFHGGWSRYSSGTAADARAYIISTFGWIISDSGLDLLDVFIFGYDIPNMIGIGILSVLIVIFIVKKRSRKQR